MKLISKWEISKSCVPADIAYTGRKYNIYGHPVDINVTDKHIHIKVGSLRSETSIYLKENWEKNVLSN